MWDGGLLERIAQVGDVVLRRLLRGLWLRGLGWSLCAGPHSDLVALGGEHDLERLVVVERDGAPVVFEPCVTNGQRRRLRGGCALDVDRRWAERLGAEEDGGARRLSRDLQ